MVLVSGEPGIGKSRIAAALQVHRARLGRPHKITLKINRLYLKKRLRILDHRGPPQFDYGNSIVDSSPFQQKGGVLVIRSYDGI
jgi:hypothetical protein